MGIEIRPAAASCPCLICEKDKGFDRKARDYGEYIEMRKECQLNCETYAYYEKYGINKLVQPDPVEMDYLITVIITILMKVEDRGPGEEDMDRLSELSSRLSVVLNMEESKVEVAYVAINRIEELRKQ